MFVHAHVTMDIKHIIFIQQLSHPNLNNVKKVWSFDFSNDIHVAIHKCNNSIFDCIYILTLWTDKPKEVFKVIFIWISPISSVMTPSADAQ